MKNSAYAEFFIFCAVPISRILYRFCSPEVAQNRASRQSVRLTKGLVVLKHLRARALNFVFTYGEQNRRQPFI